MIEAILKEFPFFDAPKNESLVDTKIFRLFRNLLEQHQTEIIQPNLDLATWTVLQIVETLVHATVIEPPVQFSSSEIENAVTDVILS